MTNNSERRDGIYQLPGESQEHFDAYVEKQRQAVDLDERKRTVNLPDELDVLKNYAPPRKPEPLPDYVAPRVEVPAVGALSAEAIVRDFEKTAKHIEALAVELTESTNQCAGELIELTQKYRTLSEQINQVVQHVKDTAAAYRDEAKLVFVRIEDTTMMMQEVRELSATMRERIANKPTASHTTVPPTNLFKDELDKLQVSEPSKEDGRR
jgi:methyl-accepting chemotaxis protein